MCFVIPVVSSVRVLIRISSQDARWYSVLVYVCVCIYMCVYILHFNYIISHFNGSLCLHLQVDPTNKIMALYSRTVSHPICPVQDNIVRVTDYQSALVIKPYTDFDEVRQLTIWGIGEFNFLYFNLFLVHHWEPGQNGSTVSFLCKRALSGQDGCSKLNFHPWQTKWQNPTLKILAAAFRSYSNIGFTVSSNTAHLE